MRFFLQILCLLLPSLALAAPPSGIYIGNQTVPLSDKALQALAQPFVSGIHINLNWSDVEPSRGTYDWTAADAAIAQAAALGKTVQLAVVPGRFSPTWATNTAASMTTISPLGAGTSQTCANITIPNIWDATYQTYWGELIAALGAHYSSNAAISEVMFEGINFNTPELMWPHFTGQTIGTCVTNNDVVSAIAAGATEENIFDAFKTFLDEYAAAFPGKYIAIQGCGFVEPPAITMAIGPGGSTDQVGAYSCQQNMLPYGVGALGNLFVVQINDWKMTVFSTQTDMSPVATYGFSGGITGAQMTNTLSGDCPGGGGTNGCDPYQTLQAMMQELYQYSVAKYVQPFPGDINNSTLAPLWRRLNAFLQQPR